MPFFRSQPALLRSLAAAALLVLGACGSEIGDSCANSSECDPDGDRVCDRVSDPSGYCTVIGCDHDTCPDEAVCIRFFGGTFANKTCDYLTEDQGPNMGTDSCSLDEVCSLQGYCALRASEIRYCMRSCGDGGDCRDNYECRDLDGMKQRGGEPVLPPGERVVGQPAKFCARAGT